MTSACAAYLKKNDLRLLTHVAFFRQNGLILSEVFSHLERSKNVKKKDVITEIIHLPKRISP